MREGHLEFQFFTQTASDFSFLFCCSSSSVRRPPFDSDRRVLSLTAPCCEKLTFLKRLRESKIMTSEIFTSSNQLTTFCLSQSLYSQRNRNKPKNSTHEEHGGTKMASFFLSLSLSLPLLISVSLSLYLFFFHPLFLSQRK